MTEKPMSTKHRLPSVAPKRRPKPKHASTGALALPPTIVGVDTTVWIVVAGTVVGIAAVVGLVLGLYFTGILTPSSSR